MAVFDISAMSARSVEEAKEVRVPDFVNSRGDQMFYDNTLSKDDFLYHWPHRIDGPAIIHKDGTVELLYDYNNNSISKSTLDSMIEKCNE